MLELIILLLSPADWLAFGLFLFGWTGFSDYADRAAPRECDLRGVTSHIRLEWARQSIAATLLILAVLYRRDFRSQTLAKLAQ